MFSTQTKLPSMPKSTEHGSRICVSLERACFACRCRNQGGVIPPPPSPSWCIHRLQKGQLFARSWMRNIIHTIISIGSIADSPQEWYVVKWFFPILSLCWYITYKPAPDRISPAQAIIPWSLVLVYPPRFFVTAATPIMPTIPVSHEYKGER